MIVGDKDDTFGIMMIHSRTPVLFANQYAWLCLEWQGGLLPLAQPWLPEWQGKLLSCHIGGNAKQNHEYSWIIMKKRVKEQHWQQSPTHIVNYIYSSSMLFHWNCFESSWILAGPAEAARKGPVPRGAVPLRAERLGQQQSQQALPLKLWKHQKSI